MALRTRFTPVFVLFCAIAACGRKPSTDPIAKDNATPPNRACVPGSPALRLVYGLVESDDALGGKLLNDDRAETVAEGVEILTRRAKALGVCANVYAGKDFTIIAELDRDNG